MAVRIRRNGRIFCAALRGEEYGDTYIDDGLHYILSVEKKILVTDDNHMAHAEWWWAGNVPNGIKISDYYLG